MIQTPSTSHGRKRNEETVARLNRKANEWQKSQEDSVLPAHTATAHWRLGAANARMSGIRPGTLYRSNPGPLFRDFNMRLRSRVHHLKHPVYDDQNIQYFRSTD
ncbi:hypothetical protein B0H13DRAFT_1898091 [Mycena leptocephala]|nr:hypothetical protein B0H13DRAFT_1898091 [Mycena leptocephala]